MAPPRRPLEIRLMERVEMRGECWIWTGQLFKDGYGAIGVGRIGPKRAHRVSYSVFVGEIPHGMLVCHKCDTPSCINPAHLSLGTPKDNTQDMIRKGRRPSSSGERHPSVKLTDRQVEEIRSLRASGRRLKEIAGMFGCSFGHVSALARGVCRAE